MLNLDNLGLEAFKCDKYLVKQGKKLHLESVFNIDLELTKIKLFDLNEAQFLSINLEVYFLYNFKSLANQILSMHRKSYILGPKAVKLQIFDCKIAMAISSCLQFSFYFISSLNLIGTILCKFTQLRFEDLTKIALDLKT